MSVIVAPRLPWYTSYWVASSAMIPFSRVGMDFTHGVGRAPNTTNAAWGGLATQLIVNGWAGPTKTVGAVIPQVGRHGSTSQSLGTSMSTPW